MLRLGVAKAKSRFGKTLDCAREAPVEILRHGKRVAVIISAEEFDRLERLSRIEDDLFDLQRARKRAEAPRIRALPE